jgi:hypothetical protein
MTILLAEATRAWRHIAERRDHRFRASKTAAFFISAWQFSW